MELADVAVGVEEVSRRYAHQFGIDRTSDWFVLKLHEELGELTQVHLMRSGQARAKGNTAEDLDRMLAAELADVVCHALLVARHHGVDIEGAIEEKWLSRLGPR